MKCPRCGSANIEQGVLIGQAAEVGVIGPEYRRGIFNAVAPMHCDICLDCGELTRFFIKEDTNKKWYKK